MASRRMPSVNVRTPLNWSRLAEYIARSARVNRSSAVMSAESSDWAIARPTLGRMDISRPPTTNESSKARMTRSATARAASRLVLDQHGELVAPEPCHGVSGADAVLDAVGDCAQQVSPAAWPTLSLTSLKSSRLSSITATGAALRRRSCIAWVSRSVNNARLARPVSGSRRAMSATVTRSWRFSSSRVSWRSSRGEDEDEAGDENGADPGDRPQVDGAEDDGERQWHVGQPQADPGRRPSRRRVGRSVRLVGQTACADQVHGKYPAQHDRVVVEGPEREQIDEDAGRSTRPRPSPPSAAPATAGGPWVPSTGARRAR